MFEMISQRKYQTAVKNLVGEVGWLQDFKTEGGPVLTEGHLFSLHGSVLYYMP